MGLSFPLFCCCRSELSLFSTFSKDFSSFSNFQSLFVFHFFQTCCFSLFSIDIINIHRIFIHSASVSMYAQKYRYGRTNGNPLVILISHEDSTYPQMSFNCDMIQKIPRKMLHIRELSDYTKKHQCSNEWWPLNENNQNTYVHNIKNTKNTQTHKTTNGCLSTKTTKGNMQAT